MLIALLITFIMAIILLFLFIMQKNEIKNISRQLKEIKATDTNELVHTVSGQKACVELIDEINFLLKRVRDNRIVYQQKNHALDQMITNISHDLRTPLTSAMGYIRIIQNSDLSEDEKNRELAIIENRLIRLEELISSFFEFSQIISNEKTPEKTEVNIVAVLEESIAHYYDDYCSKNREIVFKCEQHKFMVYSNKNMLLRIFDNLIGNALKHGIGKLLITLDNSDAIHIQFENELQDSEMDIDHIFDEFYTTDISRTKGNTGLGLAIAKQFTQLLGGKISAEYDGKLFSVTMELPLQSTSLKILPRF